MQTCSLQGGGMFGIQDQSSQNSAASAGSSDNNLPTMEPVEAMPELPSDTTTPETEVASPVNPIVGSLIGSTASPMATTPPPMPAGQPIPPSPFSSDDSNPIPTELFKPSESKVPAGAPTLNPMSSPTNTPSDLLSIKQEALKLLSPLVNHLEQTPEEKFHTTMMMMQATDDQSMVKAAYEAANAITDEKARAQALLDVINEVNYFTSKKDS